MDKWQDSLSDKLKVNPTLAKYDSVEAAMEGFVNASSRLGRSITIPDEDADDEERQAYSDKLLATAPNLTIHPDYGDEKNAAEFWKLAGVPVDAKGYTTKDGFEGLPDTFVNGLRDTALEAGWTNKQFQATLDVYAKEFASNEDDEARSRDEDGAVVKSRWGLASDQKRGSVHALIEKFQDPDHKLGDLNAAAYLMLDNIVAAFTGKGPQAFLQPQGAPALTPDEIETALMKVDKQLMVGGYGQDHKKLIMKKVKLLEMRPT